MLEIQVHVKLPKLIGAEYSRKFLDTVSEMWLRGEPLPKGISIQALSWRSRERGPWSEARSPAAINRAREDFRAITEVGLFEFTASGKSA